MHSFQHHNHEQTRKRFNVLDRFIRRSRSRRIRSFLGPTDFVLDFGCGEENWFLRSASETIGFGIGIDPNLKLDFDQNLLPENIQAKRSTIEGFASETCNRFDIITWLAVIEHFHEPEAESLLLTCASLLKPNGKIIFTTPTPFAKPILEFLAYKLHLISGEETRDHKTYYDEAGINYILERSGFSMLKHQTFQFGLNSLIVATPTKTSFNGN